MDWGVLDIFKKAEFNTLMLSVAITGWILYLLVSMNIYILGAAILASAYCVIRLVVYTYQYLLARFENKRKEAQEKKEKEDKEAERIETRNVEISRMFKGLSSEKKKKLAYVVLKGEKDLKDNIYIFRRYSNDSLYVDQAVDISKIFRDAWGHGYNCIWIRYYTDTLAVTIDPHLNDLIKHYIEEKGLELKNQ